MSKHKKEGPPPTDAKTAASADDKAAASTDDKAADDDK